MRPEDTARFIINTNKSAYFSGTPMPSQITLDSDENAEVKKSIQASSNKVYYAARDRIYYAYVGTRNWSYARLQGALAFVLNTTGNTLHFKMVDLDGSRGVIWDYELYDGLVLDQEKDVPFFLSFEGDVKGEVGCWFNFYLFFTYGSNLQKCPIGFAFLDYFDAQIFYNSFKSNKDVRSFNCELHTYTLWPIS